VAEVSRILPGCTTNRRRHKSAGICRIIQQLWTCNHSC